MFFKSKKHNVLVVGCNGMLGSYVLSRFQDEARLVNSAYGNVYGVDFTGLDITDKHAVVDFFSNPDKVKYDVVVNCAAMTDTTACEHEMADKSYEVNVLGPQYLAESCAHHKIKLIHISTDYVFSQYSVEHAGKQYEFPVNMYGLHKLLGEKNIELAYGRDVHGYVILRTSWLYGKANKDTFITKFLKNCYKAVAEGRDTVTVTTDNFGKPTSCDIVWKFIDMAVKRKHYGKMDAQYIGDMTSRAEFAKWILDEWNIYNNDLKDIGICGVEKLACAIRHPAELANVKCFGYETAPDIGHEEYMSAYSECSKSYAEAEVKKFVKQLAESDALNYMR